MWWALILLAMADEPDWGNGLTPRIPENLHADAAWRSSIGTTYYGFGDLQIGLPLMYGPRSRAGFALSVRAGLGLRHIPDEERTDLYPGSLDLGFWALLNGPRGRASHGFGLLIGGPAGPTPIYWSLQRDLDLTIGGFYQAHVDFGRWVELTTRAEVNVRAGVWGEVNSEVLPADVFATFAVSTHPIPDLSVHAGAQLGLTRSWLGVVGVRGRPAEHVELGLTFTLPIWVMDGARRGSWLRPSVEVTAWLDGPRRRQQSEASSD